jgi:hypothetical protein
MCREHFVIMPLLLMPATTQAQVPLEWYVVYVPAASILFTWLYNHTQGSLLRRSGIEHLLADYQSCGAVRAAGGVERGPRRWRHRDLWSEEPVPRAARQGLSSAGT